MKTIKDSFRNITKHAPECHEEFKEMFPNIELATIHIPWKNHYNYLITIPDSKYWFSMFIGEGSYGQYEIWDGYDEPEGCINEQGLILYMQNSKKSTYGKKIDLNGPRTIVIPKKEVNK